jgi:hypothetical protein
MGQFFFGIRMDSTSRPSRRSCKKKTEMIWNEAVFDTYYTDRKQGIVGLCFVVAFCWSIIVTNFLFYYSIKADTSIDQGLHKSILAFSCLSVIFGVVASGKDYAYLNLFMFTFINDIPQLINSLCLLHQLPKSMTTEATITYFLCASSICVKGFMLYSFTNKFQDDNRPKIPFLPSLPCIILFELFFILYFTI